MRRAKPSETRSQITAIIADETPAISASCGWTLSFERAITARPKYSSVSGGDLAQNSAQLVKIHRLGEMEIESRLSAALDVLGRGKAAERYGFHRSFSFGFGNQVVAAAIGQCNVTQNDIEFSGFENIPRILGAISHRDFVAEMTEKTGQRLQCLAVIFHHQDTQTLA